MPGVRFLRADSLISSFAVRHRLISVIFFPGSVAERAISIGFA
jgi:hypothetical protein